MCGFTYQMLVYLARHAGAVVGPEEVFSHVWSDVVVGDNALYQCVAQIRKVLGDSPAQPRYIATIPKRGYRLIADVTTAAPAEALASGGRGGNDSAALATSTPWRRLLLTLRHRAILARVFLVVLVGIGLYLTHRGAGYSDADKEGSGRLTSIAVLPFTNVSDQSGNEYFAIGLSDEILNTLSRVEGVDVVARTSSSDGRPMRPGRPMPPGVRTRVRCAWPCGEQVAEASGYAAAPGCWSSRRSR